MITHFKQIPNSAFIKVDYNIINGDLSDDAELLYIRMCKVKQGCVLTNEEAVKLFNTSEKKLLRAKKELKMFDLLATKQISKSHWMQFLGTSRVPASQVMRNYFRELEEQENDVS